jgi:hypothetical protein
MELRLQTGSFDFAVGRLKEELQTFPFLNVLSYHP